MIDAEAVHLTDTDGADILIQVAHELSPTAFRSRSLRPHPTTLALWRRAGLIDVVGEGAVFASVPDAAAPGQSADAGAHPLDYGA